MQLVYSAAPIVEAIKDADVVVLDTETCSLYPWRDGKIIAGLGIKALGGESFYIPFRHEPGKPGVKNAKLTELRKVCAALKGKRVVCHNVKFDFAVIWQEGINLWEIIGDAVDTTWLIRLVSEDEISYELERLAVKYVDKNAMEGKRELKAFMRKHKLTTYDQIPASYIYKPYVANDLRFPEGLYLKAMPFIEKRGLQELFDLEQRLMERLFHIERYGFKLDPEYVRAERKATTELVDELEEEANRLAVKALQKRGRELKLTREAKNFLTLSKTKRAKFLGEIEHEHGAAAKRFFLGFECVFTEKKVSKDKVIPEKAFDLYSPHDVKKVFEAMGIESDVKTPKGESSWAKTALAVVDHPLAEVVVRCRGIKNIKNYYVTFEELMDPDGVIHCSLHQAGTRTGRLSCREPNLQNVPRFEAFTGATTGAIASMKRLKKKQDEAAAKKKRYAESGKSQIAFDDEVAQEILSEFEGALFGKVRGAFVPRPGRFLLSVDWQQLELRLFSDYANEKELLHTFDLGLDVHRMTALAAYGSLPDPKKNQQMYKWVRNMGKQIAFGLLYGMGIALLAIEIGKSKDEAQEFMDRYFARFRYAKKWIDECHIQCTEKGFVADLWGRRRYLPKDKVYKAVNFLVQGTAADLMKDVLVRVYDAIADFDTKILVTIHDEIVFEVVYEEAEEVIPIIVDTMQTSDRIKAKLRVDAEWAPERWSQIYEDEYKDICDLSCGTCNGKGQVVNIPGLDNDEVQDELLRALYENDRALLNRAEIETCKSCGGKGYDLSKIKKPRKK